MNIINSIRLKLKFVRSFDLFGHRIDFFLKSKNIHQSVFGGCLSLSLFVIFAIVSANAFSRFLNKEEITVLTTETYSLPDNRLILNRTNFMIALGFSNPSIIDPNNSTFLIELWKRNDIRGSNGIINKNRTYIPLQRCSREHFDEFQREFDMLGLQNYLCPSLEENFILQGNWDEDVFQFLSVKILRCENQTNSQGKFVKIYYFWFFCFPFRSIVVMLKREKICLKGPNKYIKQHLNEHI